MHRKHELMENTIFVFTSDHGEMLGDHNFIQKARPYQGSIHIPMLISGSERLIGAQNRVDTSLVELRDIMPTCLDFADAKSPETLDGTSMRNGVQREYIHGEHLCEFDHKSHQFIVTKTDKYIWFSQTGDEQYFNLVLDPNETHNAINDAQAAERIACLRAILVRELDGCEEGYSDGKKLIVGCTPRAVLANATLKNI